jgi:hypothetical protein
MQKPWNGEVVRCIKEWTNVGWDANEMIHAQLTQWTNEPTNRWFNESTKQWIKEWTNQQNNESRIKWIDEPMIQRKDESMKQWINKSTNQQITETMNERMNKWISGWMDGWIDAWVSYYSLLSYLYFFTERPLRWGTSSLTAILLLWGASYMACFWSKLPPSELFCSFCNPTLRAAVTMRLATSSYNPA